MASGCRCSEGFYFQERTLTNLTGLNSCLLKKSTPSRIDGFILAMEKPIRTHRRKPQGSRNKVAQIGVFALILLMVLGGSLLALLNGFEKAPPTSLVRKVGLALGMDAGDHEESLPVALEELVPNNNAPAEKTGAQAEGSSPNPQTVLTKTVVLQGGCEGDLGQMAQDGGGSPAGRVSAASKAPPQP